MKKTMILFVFVLVNLLLSATVIQNEFLKMLASDESADDWFGASVAISGNFAIVGAPRNGSSNLWYGAAYIYYFDGSNWTEQQKLTASDSYPYDKFGSAVAIDGNYAIVGMVGDDDNGFESGAAYVFYYNGTNWIEQQKLTAQDGASWDMFGESVSISGDKAVVGVRGDDDNGDSSGSVYVYHFDGSSWLEQPKIVPSDNAAGDFFGVEVSVAGDHLMIVSRYDDDNGEDSGSVYVYRYNGTDWIETQKLTASGDNLNDYLGASISVSGNTAAISGTGQDISGNVIREVTIYNYDGTNWVEQHVLNASGSVTGDVFGSSVSFSGNYLVVGAYLDDDNGIDSGSAYLFYNDGSSWIEQRKYVASDGAADDNFGSVVAISGNQVIFGVKNYDPSDSEPGFAYIFQIENYIQPPVNSQAAIPENNTDEQSFPDASASIQFSGNHAATTIDLTFYSIEPTVIGQLPAGIVNLANNYWHVESSAGDVGSYDITFDLSNVEGIDNFTALTFLKRDDDSSPWQDVVADLGATLVYNYPFITIQGLNGFSEFVPAGGNDNTLPVTLSSFNAIRTNSNFVELNWITKSETDMSGYNLLRSENNNLNGSLKVNTSILRSENLSNEHHYTFTDNEVELCSTYYYWLEAVSMSGNIEYYGPVSVSLDEDKPEEFTKLGIMGIYPNPFNPETNIDYSVKEETPVEITIYNMKGQKVKTLVDKSVSAGDHKVVWHGDSDSESSVSSGVYFVKMITGNHIETRKIVLMK